MSRVASALIALFVLTAIPFAAPRVASACGGCFAPTGTPNIVTAHRMAVSLSASETTLWDQIQYAGQPEDFVWVLPVSAGVEVELADNAFFEALAQGTQINMTAPLPPTPCFCGSGGGFGCGSSDSASPRSGTTFGADGGAVTVFHEGSIGPYETATVMSDDAMALVDWLQERGYGVPDSIVPTIVHYSELGLASPCCASARARACSRCSRCASPCLVLRRRSRCAWSRPARPKSSRSSSMCLRRAAHRR